MIPEVRMLKERNLHKPAVLLAALVVSLLVVALAFRWWDSYVEDGLGRWAVDELARRTDSTYRLALGDLSLRPFAGSISVDSATVMTDSARNRRRSERLPALTVGARECRASGLDLVRLAFRRSFSARALECRRVVAVVDLVPRASGEERFRLTIARLDADFTDSTLSLAGAEHEPAIPEAEWARRLRVRRDRVHLTLDSLQGRGVAYRAFLTRGDIEIRALELHGGRLDVLTDRRIPRRQPRRHRTPQQVAARTRSALRLDTVLVTGGTIVYRERKPETERPGVVVFEQVRATIHDLDLPSDGEPLRIEASGRLMGEGLLTARASVPLDAPDFRYELSGRLDRMPAKALNQFLAPNESYQFDDGVVEEITFRQAVRGGRAVTSVTPRYRELSVEPTGEGGGVIGSVTRGAKEFLAGAFTVRSRNPDDNGKDLRTGRTVRRYPPERTWLQFIWFALRDGLTEVAKE
jgi:hypothetical protein